MSAVTLGLQKSWGGRAGGCEAAGRTVSGGGRPPAFLLVSDDEPPAAIRIGWRTVVVVR